MNSLAHTSWECKYHIVFAPKYRRQVIYGKMKAEIGKILRELCERKGIRDHSSRMLSGSYTYADSYTAQIQRIRNCWIFERKKFLNYF